MNDIQAKDRLYLFKDSAYQNHVNNKLQFHLFYYVFYDVDTFCFNIPIARFIQLKLFMSHAHTFMDL